MLEHHIQKDILKKLVRHEAARFADLKPPTIEGNIFTYHLQQLIKQKYVEKGEDGKYHLTSSGKAVGINSDLSAQEMLEQAHSILLIVVRDGDRWLLRKRLAQPAYGLVGFVHGEPTLRETVCETAERILTLRTGLLGSCAPVGTGYIRIFKNKQMESFTHFTMLEAKNISGEVTQVHRTGENIWYNAPDFSDAAMLPSMADLVKKLDEPGFFFAELEYHI